MSILSTSNRPQPSGRLSEKTPKLPLNGSRSAINTFFSSGNLEGEIEKINQPVFKQFSQKPEEFIMKAISIINGQKATTIVEHIEYKKLDSPCDTSIFTDKKIKGAINNSVKTPHKHIYNYVIADSSSMPEKGLAETLKISEEV